MGWYVKLAQDIGKLGNRRRRVEYDFRPAQNEAAGSFREVPVVADVDADLAHARVEDRVPQITRPEVELFPETGGAMGDMHLAELAQVAAVGIDHGRGVVVNPR